MKSIPFLDRVILVDNNDQVIGEMDKIEAHRGEGRLHRASSVYLFRKNSQTQETELLLQQRSTQKIVGANQWGNTVCGNVKPGENYHQCALRRLRQEMGIEGVNIRDIYHFTYQARCNDEFSEHEMDHVFVGWFDGAVKMNPIEAKDFVWESWEKLLDQSKKMDFEREVSPWTQIMLSDTELTHKIQTFLEQ